MTAQEIFQALATQIGNDLRTLNFDPANLTTTTKTSLVAAVNELKALLSTEMSSVIDDAAVSAETTYSSTKITEILDAAIAAIQAGAPEAFDTLNEIATWIGTDETGTSDLLTSINNLLRYDTTQVLTEQQRSNVYTTLELDLLGLDVENIYDIAVSGDSIVGRVSFIFGVVGGNSTMAISTDGETWTLSTITPLGAWPVASSITIGSRIYALGFNAAANVLAYTDDYGATWQSVALAAGSTLFSSSGDASKPALIHASGSTSTVSLLIHNEGAAPTIKPFTFTSAIDIRIATLVPADGTAPEGWLLSGSNSPNNHFLPQATFDNNLTSGAGNYQALSNTIGNQWIYAHYDSVRDVCVYIRQNGAIFEKNGPDIRSFDTAIEVTSALGYTIAAMTRTIHPLTGGVRITAIRNQAGTEYLVVYDIVNGNAVVRSVYPRAREMDGTNYTYISSVKTIDGKMYQARVKVSSALAVLGLSLESADLADLATWGEELAADLPAVTGMTFSVSLNTGYVM